MDRAVVLTGRVADAPGTVLEALLEALPYAKRLELEARDAAGRRAGLAGIALALAVLGRLRGSPVRAAELAFPQGGKPALPGGPDFSITHAGDAVGVAAVPSGSVGFDLEPFLGEAGRARLERWTATEAVLKAAGRGVRDAAAVELSPALDRARLEGREYWVRAVDAGDAYVARLATDRSLVRVDLERDVLSALPGPF
jgi:phosphopantetheinyl transferase